jgi:hypothetical protein
VACVAVQHQIKRTLCDVSAINWMRALLANECTLHRTGVADRACEHFGFLDPRGRFQRSSCLKALRELEEGGLIALPAPRTRRGAQCRMVEEPVPVPGPMPRGLRVPEAVQVVLVESAAQRRVWRALMAHEHPRGAGPLVGRQLRYLVGSEQGWLGALGFAAAALKLADRERWIGWSGAQRRLHLHRGVCLNRFLIRPMVHCPNLASHVLGQVLKRLRTDFARRYGYRPWWVESFVEPGQSGACYRAANWQRIGQTRGRGRQDRSRDSAETCKAIYVYVLDAAFRATLGLAPSAPAPLAPGEGLEAARWAQHEFGDAPLGDKRRSQRLVDSAQRQAEEPMRAFTGVAQSDWAAVKGYYRLIDQPATSEVTPHNILRPHRERTVRRMQAQRTVLCVQDGTDLNFATHEACTGLGVIGTNQTQAQTRGLHLHSTLAVSGEGLPLGVLRAHFAAPEPRTPGAPKAPLQERKSFQWIEGLRDCVAAARDLPDTRVISVMDREADFLELFDAQRREPRVELLVRARYNRRTREEAHLFEAVAQSPERGRLSITLTRQSARAKRSKTPARAKREARIAEVALRYREVELAPTAHEHRHKAPLRIGVVHVVEDHPGEGVKKPLQWFLLTTVPITSPADAEQVLHWYCLRWRIEDWHRILKTGCRIEKLGHATAERLERAIAINLVIAWRIMLLTLLGRETPELPPEVLFDDIEIRVLGAFAKSRNLAPPQTLGEAVLLVARLGGYLARQHDPPPGHQLMWHGYTQLIAMAAGFALREEYD